MLFPLRTDRKLSHIPWMNITLVVINVGVYLWQLWSQQMNDTYWTTRYLLSPDQPEIAQFFTYSFRHASEYHLGLNMFFLFVFGNSLEDRLGPVGYLAFYLAGAGISGMGHCMAEGLTSQPILGASGAVSAVTGAYLALFPMSRVTLVWIIPIFDPLKVPSMHLILFMFGSDLVGEAMGTQSVAFMAHISGSLFGFALGITLLATRFLAREPYDFLVLVDRWVHPQLRAVDPIEAHALEVSPHLKAVLGALERGDESGAVERYGQLAKRHRYAVLPRQKQLDLADHAMKLGRYRIAAMAYEGFLSHHPDDSFVGQVDLVLGLIYSSHIHRPDRAKAFLEDALEHLTDETQREAASEALSRIA